MKRADWQTVVIAVVGIGCVTACILLGKGNTLIQVFAAIGGVSGVAALLKFSPLHGAPTEPPKGDP